MTQELKEQMQELALYDGWKVIPEGTYIECHNQTTWFGHGGKFDCYHDITSIDNMKYHTSYDALIPVAKKVCNELDAIRNTKGKDRFIDCTEMENEIESLLLSDISNLFFAVHAAIVFLNAQKEQK